MAMEKTLAPSVVNPPCARRMAWKSRMMVPNTAIDEGPKRMAPSATPVGCEQLPVTDGILSAESTNEKAPDMPRVSLLWGDLCTWREIVRIPQTTKGAETANQNRHHSGGK